MSETSLRSNYTLALLIFQLALKDVRLQSSRISRFYCTCVTVFGCVQDLNCIYMFLFPLQSLISASLTDNTASETSELYAQSKKASQSSPSSKKRHHASPRQEEQPRELPEYKAAIELELWKEHQEEVFKTMVYFSQ